MADFPSDQKPAIDQVYLKFVLATEVANIESISFKKCSEIKGFIRGITALDIESAGFINSFIPTAYQSEMDEMITEEILCSKNVLYVNQPVALIAANSPNAAEDAAKLVDVSYSVWKNDNLTQPVQFEEAISSRDFFPSMEGFQGMDKKMSGDVDKIFAEKGLKEISGNIRMPGQYHHFMEPHHASVNLEDDQVIVNIGSQVSYENSLVFSGFQSCYLRASIKCNERLLIA